MNIFYYDFIILAYSLFIYFIIYIFSSFIPKDIVIFTKASYNLPNLDLNTPQSKYISSIHLN